MFLYFPQMHPELLSVHTRECLPQGARFLDPGLGAATSPEHVRPESAPFDPRMAKALLADTLRFGEAQAHPRDILAQSLIGQAGALSPESGRAVQLEVEKSLLGGAAAADAAAPLEAPRRQAQMLLLLAWSLEERLLDLRSVEGKLKSAWDRLDASVAAGSEAVDEEVDPEALVLGRELSGLMPPEASVLSTPWRRLLESFAVLMPGQSLCTAEPEVVAALVEAGVPEAPLAGLPGATRVFRAQVWRLMGHEAPPKGKPWLDEMLTLGGFAPAVGKD